MRYAGSFTFSILLLWTKYPGSAGAGWPGMPRGVYTCPAPGSSRPTCTGVRVRSPPAHCASVLGPGTVVGTASASTRPGVSHQNRTGRGPPTSATDTVWNPAARPTEASSRPASTDPIR